MQESRKFPPKGKILPSIPLKLHPWTLDKKQTLTEDNPSNYLERKGEEVSPDLPETVDTDAVVATVVQVLDITHLCVLVIGDNLTSVPT